MGRGEEQLGGPRGHPFPEVPDTLFTRSLSSVSGWDLLPGQQLGGHTPPFFGSASG